MIARYWDEDSHAYLTCEVVYAGRGSMPHEREDAAFWARMGRGRTTKLRGRQGSRRSTDPMRASIPGVRGEALPTTRSTAGTVMW